MRRAVAGLALVAVHRADGVALGLRAGAGPGTRRAASHREAPLISLDPAADITDFFMFRSYEPGKRRQGRPDHGRQSRVRSRARGRTTSTSTRTSATRSASTTTGTATRTTSGSTSSSRTRSAASSAQLGSAALVRPASAAGHATLRRSPGSEGLGLRQKYTVTLTTGGAGTHRQQRARQRPDRGAVERRPADDAELPGARRPGHLRPRRRRSASSPASARTRSTSTSARSSTR